MGHRRRATGASMEKPAAPGGFFFDCGMWLTQKVDVVLDSLAQQRLQYLSTHRRLTISRDRNCPVADS
jgi:hypothetical protein